MRGPTTIQPINFPRNPNEDIKLTNLAESVLAPVFVTASPKRLVKAGCQTKSLGISQVGKGYAARVFSRSLELQQKIRLCESVRTAMD